jgi:CheY-like chemotaxis protein
VTLKVGEVTEPDGGGDRNSRRSTPDSLPNGYRRLRFQIEDTGIGMSSAQLSHIFVPFEQVGDRAHQIEGTGLGLAISRQLVEMMGGELQVESELEKGSRFYFELTVKEVDFVSETKRRSERPIRGFLGAPRQLLVVDDKWENRSVLANLLSPLGFEILEASNGQECLDRLFESKPDCILLDLVMPVMDGFEVIRRIRNSQELNDVAIVATSASVFERDRQSGFAAGCDAFLPKPIRADELLECLQIQLGLEWIYEVAEETVGDRIVPPSSPEPAKPQELMPPPAEEIAILFDLAMMGDIQGIQDRAEYLNQLDAKYAPFANQLSELATELEEEKILELVQKYREANT